MVVLVIKLMVTLAVVTPLMPLLAEAQPTAKVRRIGFLSPAFDVFALSSRVPGHLQLLGWSEGTNVRFEHRVAVGSDERLPDLAEELARLGVDVVVASGTAAALAAKTAAPGVPVVAAFEGDPVKAGLVAGLGRPGGSVTGVATFGADLIGKRIELLREAVPGLSRVGVLWNPAGPEAAEHWREAVRAAGILGLELVSLEARRREELEPSFRAARGARCGALLVLTHDRLMRSHAAALTKLAVNARLPALYPDRYFVDPRFGGLMSYGEDFLSVSSGVAAYVDKVLKGARPADLPVERPTRYELVIDLKTAKALGLTIPPSLLLRADKVIE